MTIETAIAERLAGLAPVAALVGTRVYQMKLPQRPDLPAVRVQVIGETDDPHLRGVDSLKRTRVQVDAYAEDSGSGYTAATNLADAIHGDGRGDSATGLQGYVGDAGGSPPEIRIHAMFRVPGSRRPMYEAGELRLYRIQQDYMVWWESA